MSQQYSPKRDAAFGTVICLCHKNWTPGVYRFSQRSSSKGAKQQVCSSTGHLLLGTTIEQPFLVMYPTYKAIASIAAVQTVLHDAPI